MRFIYHHHLNHLEVACEGEFDLTANKACINEIFRLCDEHRYDKVLVDSRGVAEELSLASRFNLGEPLAAAYARPIRIAVLCSTAQVMRTKLLKNTANNRGAQVQTTDSEVAAFANLGIDQSRKAYARIVARITPSAI